MSEQHENRDHALPGDAIVAHLAEGDLAPAELAERLGMSMRELAQWASDPANIRLLASLAFLADVRAQMLLSRYRANTVARLIAIATDAEASEMARKACVDLLEANLDVFAPRNEDEPAPPQLNEGAVLQALAKLGGT